MTALLRRFGRNLAVNTSVVLAVTALFAGVSMHAAMTWTVDPTRHEHVRPSQGWVNA